MKLHDFGLWFWSLGNRWSITIPQKGYFEIFYDGVELGYQYDDFDLMVYDDNHRFSIRLKNNFTRRGAYEKIGRQLTMDDFEIIPTPIYRGDANEDY